MERFELKPIWGQQQSFYGRAIVISDGDATYLKSYGTIVCSYDMSEGYANFRRHWHGYSATTQRHINAFIDLVMGCGEFYAKAQWLKEPITQLDIALKEKLLWGE